MLNDLEGARRLPTLAGRMLYTLALVSTLLAPVVVTALPDDRNQPIHIEADEALRDEKKGFTRYRGHVKMEQGSLHIEADRITVYHRKEEADRIVAQGSPARLQQQPEADKAPVRASAEIIEYFRSEERVQLRNNASIEQEGSVVNGDSINYYISEQLLRADSDKSRAGSRVQVVIPAQAIEGREGDSGAADSQ